MLVLKDESRLARLKREDITDRVLLSKDILVRKSTVHVGSFGIVSQQGQR